MPYGASHPPCGSNRGLELGLKNILHPRGSASVCRQDRNLGMVDLTTVKVRRGQGQVKALVFGSWDTPFQREGYRLFLACGLPPRR